MLKTEQERNYWSQLNEQYMTEESEDEESGVINQHPLTWTSDSKFHSHADDLHDLPKVSLNVTGVQIEHTWIKQSYAVAIANIADKLVYWPAAN